MSAVVPRPDHIVVVMEENHDYSQIIGSSAAPYINSLAAQGALMTNSHGVTHPSQPNYLDIFSGSNQGVTNDTIPAHQFTTANLGKELIAKGDTFKGYSEDLPGVGSLVASAGDYKRKHNPWSDWQGTGTNQIPTSTNQPFTAFPTNFATLPNVSFVVPNQVHDMHSGSIQAGDSWLQTHIDAYAQWAKTHNSVLIVTFDENNGLSGNKIATIIVGQHVTVGHYAENINHYNVLRTIEDAYGLSYAGASATAKPITDIWKAPKSPHHYDEVPLFLPTDVKKNHVN